MKTKNYIYIFVNMLFISVFVSKAQIGINTENPQTLFHVDVLKNNTGSTPLATEQLDDLYLGLGLSNEAVMSLGKIPERNTQLLLNNPYYGFLPNKVSLSSQLDVTTVPNPQIGMFVYNTRTVSGINGVIPGLYVYDENKWKYLFTEDSKKLQIRPLKTAVTTPNCGATSYSCAAQMDFGDDIVIPQDGAYGVGVSLYGKHPGQTVGAQREIVYIWLLADGVPQDVAELNLVSIKDKTSTYTVFLGGNFKVGEKLTCKISTNTPTQYKFEFYPSKTFAMYWRLEQISM